MNKLGNAISMKEAKEKLKNLKIEDDVGEFVAEFGKFLSGRLNDTLVPSGFMLACELALNDLSTGIDGYSGKPIFGRLVGQPPSVYSVLRMRIPEITKQLFPEEFHKGVVEFMEEVNRKMAEGK